MAHAPGWPACCLRAGFSTAALLTALFLAWQLLAQADYLYRVWYPLIGIDRTIAEYGPKNIHRRDFHTTTPAEHARLFGLIGAAINHHGAGLTDIAYLDAHGRVIDRLLTPAEITHLRDVAQLVHRFKLAGWFALVTWALLLAWASLRCLPLPGLAQSLRYTLAGVLAGAIIIVLLGPVRVFYALHHWVFPAGHQWFFYYEESLMTMLMQAPDLFGWIGAAWLLLTLIIFTALLRVSAWLQGSRCAGGGCGT